MRLQQAHVLHGSLVTQRRINHGTVEYPDGGADRYGRHCRPFGAGPFSRYTIIAYFRVGDVSTISNKRPPLVNIPASSRFICRCDWPTTRDVGMVILTDLTNRKIYCRLDSTCDATGASARRNYQGTIISYKIEHSKRGLVEKVGPHPSSSCANKHTPTSAHDYCKQKRTKVRVPKTNFEPVTLNRSYPSSCPRHALNDTSRVTQVGNRIIGSFAPPETGGTHLF